MELLRFWPHQGSPFPHRSLPEASLAKRGLARLLCPCWVPGGAGGPGRGRSRRCCRSRPREGRTKECWSHWPPSPRPALWGPVRGGGPGKRPCGPLHRTRSGIRPLEGGKKGEGVSIPVPAITGDPTGPAANPPRPAWAALTDPSSCPQSHLAMQSGLSGAKVTKGEPPRVSVRQGVSEASPESLS